MFIKQKLAITTIILFSISLFMTPTVYAAIMKKYYGIDDHRDLIKYSRLNGLEHHEHYDKNDVKIKSQQSSLLFN